MANCAHCRCTVPAAAPPPVLLQIRRRYGAQWKDLAFLVDGSSGDCTLSVRNARSEAVYTAHRASLRDAQIAAAEYAFFCVPGAESHLTPERLAREWNWLAQ